MSSFGSIHILRCPTLKKKVCNFVGGVQSPLLANIYLHELDKHMESKHLNLSDVERARRRGQGQSTFLYVRYADEWVVLCNGTEEQPYTMKKELHTVLENMGLKLSEGKTKITHI